ncbi:MAG: transposase [Bacteroidales bacterium]|jgi:REP element-mobilizing transposase RayT|nr:hypothetical protein [Bacteroidales bacterium]
MSLKIEYGKYYHIFNRGNNKEILFHEDADFSHFLNLYSTYILPVSETLSWCLMNNHFHFCVRVKEKEEIGFLNPDDLIKNKNPLKWKINNEQITPKYFKPIPSRQFAHLFNAYSKWYNFKYSRSGSLFEKNFERSVVTSESYLVDLIVYINANPLKHKIKTNAQEYLWSSAKGIIEGSDALCNTPLIWNYFDDSENFKHVINTCKWSEDFWKDSD